MRPTTDKSCRLWDHDFDKILELSLNLPEQTIEPQFVGCPHKIEFWGNDTTVGVLRKGNQGMIEEEKLIQISFEAGFMDQHKMCLLNQERNLLEACFKSKDLVELGFQAIKNMDYIHFQPRTLSAYENSELNSLANKKDKLSEFIHLITNSHSREVASELLFVSWMACKAYIKINDHSISEWQLVERAEKNARADSHTLFYQQGLKFITLEALVDKFELNAPNLVRTAFEEFLVFFYITIFLILEGYFENPYSQKTQTQEIGEIGYEMSIQTEEDSWELESNIFPTKYINNL